MTANSENSRKRKHDGADQREKIKEMPLVSGAGTVLTIKCGGLKVESAIAVHESMTERSSSFFQALVKKHRIADKVVLREVKGTSLTMHGSADLAKYVHFLYTNEIVRDKFGFVPDVVKALMAEWMFGLALQDARYCNALMDKLIETDAAGKDVFLAVQKVNIDPSEVSQAGTPLWDWAVEHIGATLSENDIDCLDQIPAETQSKAFMMDLLKRVLEQFKGQKHRQAPTLADWARYHLTEGRVEEVWQQYYDSDYY